MLAAADCDGPADAFFAAVAAGDVDAVRAMLDDEPALLAAVSTAGVRPPLVALYNSHFALADELAGRSAPLDVHESSAFDDNGRLRAVLLENPDAVNSWSLDGWQPLHLAAFFGRVEAVRQLLDDDASVLSHSRNSCMSTALHSAAAGRSSEIVWLLLASGAHVDDRQRGGRTALHIAAKNGDTDSIAALRAADASIESRDDDGALPRDLAPSPESRALLDS